MSNLIVRRTIAADPAATALLVSGAGAASFWPGLWQQHYEPGFIAGQLHRLGEDVSHGLTIRVAPPRRTPTAYLTRFDVVVDGVEPLNGAISVTGTGWWGAESASSVSVELTSDEDWDAERRERLRLSAEQFLDNIAGAAEGRLTVALAE